jgi:hypothetical protein
VNISATQATPGYLPGPLPAGIWTAQIDAHMIMPGEALQYRLAVTISEGEEKEIGDPMPLRARPAKASRHGAGWYRGDLHTHTDHSDAGDCTVGQLIKMARDHGLDFVFLTDHNTTAGLAEMDASATEDLLAAGGIELTTFWGHAVCLGTREWVDWRVHPGTGDMSRIAAETDAMDQLFIIAHPQATGDPACTGCTWRYGGMMPGNAKMVEIWNGPWGGDSNNEAALSLWYDWLNQGLRLVATAGTDTHGVHDYGARPAFSVVYAEALSEPALIRALRAGHVYLSAGPEVIFQARTDGGERWIMGDTVTQPAMIVAAWDGCPADAQIRLMADGRPLAQWMAGARGDHEWPMGPDQAHWVVVEIRGGDGGLLAITNPIYLAQDALAAQPWPGAHGTTGAGT